MRPGVPKGNTLLFEPEGRVGVFNEVELFSGLARNGERMALTYFFFGTNIDSKIIGLMQGDCCGIIIV